MKTWEIFMVGKQSGNEVDMAIEPVYMTEQQANKAATDLNESSDTFDYKVREVTRHIESSSPTDLSGVSIGPVTDKTLF